MERIVRKLLETLEKGVRTLFQISVIVYQIVLSPLLGERCRFYPSCSHYAREMLSSKTISLPQALLFVFWRLLRCNPFFRGGVDLAPTGRKK